MGTKWEFFELDGAYFRKRANSGLAAVDDVFWPEGWTPYRGDPCRPFCWGSKISESELPVAARASRAAN